MTPPVVGPATRSTIGARHRRGRGPPSSRTARSSRPDRKDVELLDVGVAVAAALEQEVALAERAGATEQLLGRERDGGAGGDVEGGLDRGHGASLRGLASRSCRRPGSGPVLDALRGRRAGPRRQGRPDQVAVARDATRGGTRPRARRRAGPAGSGRRRSPCRPGPRPPDRQEVEDVGEVRDAADGDDRDVHDLGGLVDDPQRDRLDGRTRQAAVRCCRAAAGSGPARRRCRRAC